MGTLADILTEAGHNVTVLMPLMDPAQKDKTGLKITKNIIMVPTDPRVLRMKEFEKDILSDIWNMKPSIFELNRAWAATNMQAMFPFQCERVINDKPLMERLEKEKFDLGMAEFISACGLGIIEAVKIPASVVVYSVVYHDLIAQLIGEPSIPSYVPGYMSASSDRMNLLERFKNAVDMIFGHNFFLNMYRREIEVIRARFGSDFKNYEQLVVESSLVLSNSNPYLDFPRPMLYKTVPIGGISFSKRIENNKLSEKWNTILDKRNRTVLVSFGTVMKAIFMPEQYKKTLLDVFKSMPETTFIMKYEEEDSKIVNHLPNVYLATWLPQKELLADPRVTVFVTHAGLGSTTEIAYTGKASLLIPIFADQLRNANMLARHGGAIVLSKFDLENKEKLKDSLRSLLNDERYSQNAKRLSEMLRNQPISPKELFIRHIEFAARFGRLPNLISYGTQLSFLQYYFLDIFLAFFLTIIAAIYLIFKTFSKCFQSSPKIKND
ncbi:hypothetical protein RB195_003492 [Necator americanus]